MFNIITWINESKTLTKHISCEFKYKFDGRNCNLDQWWNSDECWYESRKRHVCEKDYVWNPATCICENGKYLGSIMNDSAVILDEVIDSYEEKTNFNEKKPILKTQNFYILLVFLLITIALLIAFSIYCYLIKYWANKKSYDHFMTQIMSENKFYIDNLN